MSHTIDRRFALLATTVASVAVFTTGCGRLVERATEEAVEQAVENDSGEEVDIDVGGGEIRVESDQGDITFSADEDGVNIEGTDADGNDFSVDVDEDGVDVEGADDSSLDIDDDGTFVATDESGEVFSGEVDDDGGVTVEGADGESVFVSSDGIPEQWPGDVPRPEGLSDVTGTYISEVDALSIIITGTATGSVPDVLDRYSAALAEAGFEEESTFGQGADAASSSYVRGEQRITVSVQSFGGETEMVVALT